MRYVRFSIKNFKGIKDVDIDLSNNRIVTLIGLNESGKTTILEAIQLFYELTRNSAEPSKEKLNAYRPKGTDFTGKIAIEAELEFEDSDYKKIQALWEKEWHRSEKLVLPQTFSSRYEFEYELHEYIKSEWVCGFDVSLDAGESKRSLYDFDQESWQCLIRNIKQALIPEIILYEDFIFNIPEKITYNCSTSSTNDTRNQEWQLVLDDILRSVNNQFSFQAHVVDIWFSDNNTAKNRIVQMEDALNAKITTAWKALFQTNKKVHFKEIKMSVESVHGNGIAVSFEVKTDEGKIFLINERSKGCKWFFSFLLFTEFRKNRTKNILFLLDEPASNLHASAQEKIVQAIQDLSTQAMVIYSTHSAHLINPEWLAGAYVVVNDILSEDVLKGELAFNTSVEITVKKYFYYIGSGEGSDKLSFFQPILDALEYRPSQLDLIPEIVIVEGKYDWNGYKYFNEILLKTGKNYNFYPGGGKEKLFDIIRLYLAWGRKFLVLLDGDAEKSKKKYISEFGEFVANRIYTLKDVFGEKYCLENLIEDCDKNTLYNSVFPETPYDELPNSKKKSNLNIAINKLLWEKKSVEVSKTTQDRFSTLFDFIEKHL